MEPNIEPNITTETYKRHTTYRSDDSTMVTNAFERLTGEWVVYINGKREVYSFATRVQAEDYAKTVLAVHLTVTPWS